MQRIQSDLTRTTFDCHETVYRKGTTQRRKKKVRQHCAGALILLRKTDSEGPMQQVAYRLGLYDPKQLDMQAPVYDTFEQMIAAQHQ